MFDRLAHYRAVVGAWRDHRAGIKEAKEIAEAEKGGPLIQDRPGFETEGESGPLESQRLALRRREVQEDIASLLSHLATRLREWNELNNEIRTVLWSESGGDPSFTPSNLNSSAMAMGGGQLLKDVTREDVAALQLLVRHVGLAQPSLAIYSEQSQKTL